MSEWDNERRRHEQEESEHLMTEVLRFQHGAFDSKAGISQRMYVATLLMPELLSRSSVINTSQEDWLEDLENCPARQVCFDALRLATLLLREEMKMEVEEKKQVPQTGR